MKPVVQLERTGCGIACAATIAGVSYTRAKTLAARIGISAADERLWSGTAQVRRLLRQFGLRCGRGEEAFRGWNALPDLALLSTKWHLERGRPFWHWVVFVRDAHGPRVLDPKQGLRRNVRTDFGRMRPNWFIRIYLPSADSRTARRESAC